MRKLTLYFTLAISILLGELSPGLHAANFPVMAYQNPTFDNSSIAQWDSAFAQLRTFGIDLISPNNMDSRILHLYKKNGIRLVSFGMGASTYADSVEGNWYSTLVTLSDTLRPYYMFDFVYFGVYNPTSGNNEKYQYGYRWNTTENNGIGRMVDDQFRIGTQVRSASVGTDSPGNLYPSFVYNARTMANPSSGGYTAKMPYKMRAQLRIADRSGDSMAIVAKLIVENQSAAPCYTDSMENRWNTEFVDDTMMIVYHGDGTQNTKVDTLRGSSILQDTTGYRRFIPNKLTGDMLYDYPIYDHCFIGSWRDTSGAWNTEKICALPFRFTKNIRVKDFHNTSSYHDLDMKCWLAPIDNVSCYGPSYNYYVQWTGAKTLYLDSVIIGTDTGFTFATKISKSDIRGRLDNYCTAWRDSVGADSVGQIFGDHWEILDEVATMAFSTAGQWRDIVSGCTFAPKKILGAERPHVAVPNANDLPGNKMGIDLYQHYYGDVMPTDPYPFTCETRFDIVDPHDPASATYALNIGLVDYFRRLNAHRMTMDTIIDWWYIAQADAGWSIKDKASNVWTKGGQFPPAEGMRAQLNLALCYNTKGFIYYQSIGGVDANQYLDQFPPLAKKSFVGMDFTTEYYPAGTCDSQFPQGFAPVKAGLMKQIAGNHSIVPFNQSSWDAAASVNQFAKRNSDFYLGATWLGAGDESIVSSVPGTVISRIVSTVPTKPAYIEASFWSYQGDKYCMLVNKRTPVNDSSILRIDFSTGPGMTEVAVIDGTPVQIDTVYDSVGVLTKYQMVIQPGAAKLMRIRHKETFKGNWSGTWPEFSTIKVVGDIVVDSNKTLVIGTSRMTLTSHGDSLAAGTDPQRIEINVHGTLRLTGTSTNRVWVGPQVGLEKGNDWYGITCLGSTSKVEAENVIVKYASHRAFTLNGNGDFVKKSRIEDCVDGIYCPQGTYTLQQDTFLSTNMFYSGYLGVDSVGYGMRYGVQQASGSGTPQSLQDCYFKDVKYPIYIASASPVVSNCNIIRTGPILNSTIGTPGIWVANSSSPTFSGCRVENYLYGMRLDTNSHVQISYGEFMSSSYQGINPYMDIGIKASLATSSSCKVRNTCFDGIHRIAVYAGKSQFDLGTNADRGHNNFIAFQYCPGGTEVLEHVDDSTFGHQMQQNGVIGPPRDTLTEPCQHGYFPDTIICNVDSIGHVSAWGNYYDPKYNPLAGYFAGLVDWYYPLSIPETFCGMDNTPPVEKKVDSVKKDVAIKVFSVDQNYPNPFNPTTQISFSLPTASHVTVHIFNVLGQLLKTVSDEEFASGDHTVVWDGRGSDGAQVSSGVYFYRVIAGDNIVTRKMILLR